MTKDEVIFRKFIDNDVIALFPKMCFALNLDYIMSYMHTGQHGEASKSLIDLFQPAKPEEYQDLLDELIAIGYDVEVCNE